MVFCISKKGRARLGRFFFVGFALSDFVYQTQERVLDNETREFVLIPSHCVDRDRATNRLSVRDQLPVSGRGYLYRISTRSALHIPGHLSSDPSRMDFPRSIHTYSSTCRITKQSKNHIHNRLRFLTIETICVETHPYPRYDSIKTLHPNCL